MMGLVVKSIASARSDMVSILLQNQYVYVDIRYIVKEVTSWRAEQREMYYLNQQLDMAPSLRFRIMIRCSIVTIMREIE